MNTKELKTNKCIAIGGVPATGKTTLVKEIYNQLNFQNFKYGLLRGHYNQDNNLSLLGIYNEDSVFLGTDKLSMAVNKHFIKYIEANKRNILFEGDRLFSLKNIEFINQYYDLRVIVLNNTKKVIEERHQQRNDSQSEKFIKGRYTKIQNIISNSKSNIETYILDNLDDTKELANNIISWYR